MNFSEYLKTAAEEINQELDIFLKNWNKEVLSHSPKLLDLNKFFIQANLGGKRLRGALVKLGYEIAKDSIGRRGDLQNDELSKEILKPAAAYEIFQTAILAHDDIIDKSDLRRGNPTLWKQLGGDHYGVSQTICLGDIGFFLAYKLISESNFPEKEKNQAISFFTDSMLKTALGEMLDIEIPHLGQGDETDALTIFKLKTALYTLTGPLQLGAVLGQGDKGLLGRLGEFGEKLGVAFQIQDDILGIFGTEKVLGKSVTSDIEEGKLTLLILYAKKHCLLQQEKILNKYYGTGKIGVREVGEIRDIFIKTKALDYSQKRAEKLVSDAKKVIPLITNNSQLKTVLEEMADFLVKRKK